MKKEEMKNIEEEKLEEVIPVSLDTMANIGKKKILAGREYEICPVNIEDMHYVLNGNDLFIPLKNKKDEEDLAIQLIGLNIVDEKKSRVFYKVVEKYVRYKGNPVTKKLLIEHNWSFKDIREFLLFWVQEVSD